MKYVIIIYELGSARERFGVWIKAVPKPKFPAEPFQIETAVLNWFRRRTFHLLNEGLGSAHERFGVWTGPERQGSARVMFAPHVPNGKQEQEN